MSRRLFTDAERAILRAADHVVDQGEPGGALYYRDRDPVDSYQVANADRALQSAATKEWRQMQRARGAA